MARNAGRERGSLRGERGVGRPPRGLLRSHLEADHARLVGERHEWLCRPDHFYGRVVADRDAQWPLAGYFYIRSLS